MKRIFLARVGSSLLFAIALISQSLRPTIALACVPGQCVYLPQVSRPPYLTILSKVGPQSKLGFEISGYMMNTTGTALKNIVVVTLFQTSGGAPPFSYTQTFFGNTGYRSSSLAPDEIYKFGYNGCCFSFPLVTMTAISWTVALTKENQPLDIASISTTPADNGAGYSYTIVEIAARNLLSETLLDSHVTIWAIDESESSKCKFLDCYVRKYGLTFLPGELQTITVDFPGSVPLSAIRVAAHGVISP